MNKTKRALKMERQPMFTERKNQHCQDVRSSQPDLKIQGNAVRPQPVTVRTWTDGLWPSHGEQAEDPARLTLQKGRTQSEDWRHGPQDSVWSCVTETPRCWWKNRQQISGQTGEPETDARGPGHSPRTKEQRLSLQQTLPEPLHTHVQQDESTHRPYTLHGNVFTMDHGPESKTQNHKTPRGKQEKPRRPRGWRCLFTSTTKGAIRERENGCAELNEN